MTEHDMTAGGNTPSDNEPGTKKKSSVRLRADAIREFRCKNLVVVLENPHNPKNIGAAIRNANAMGAEKVYVVDPDHAFSDEWEDIRNHVKLGKISVSASKWTFVKRFDSTRDCLAHLEKNNFTSLVTSPHIKGRDNFILEDGDYTPYTKLAVWFGSESQGISDEAIAGSAACINIPMFGMVESLNLGTSTGIVLYEITRQRRRYQQALIARRNRTRDASS